MIFRIKEIFHLEPYVCQTQIDLCDVHDKEEIGRQLGWVNAAQHANRGDRLALDVCIHTAEGQHRRLSRYSMNIFTWTDLKLLKL